MMLLITLALVQAKDAAWATDWDEALKEAKARNVPILWSVHQDG